MGLTRRVVSAAAWTDVLGPAPGGHHLPGLDGLRGVAVLLVVATHANLPFARYGGMAGVSLFFVLSGFLITALLLEERERTGSISLRSFAVRRLLRLLPALVVAVGIGTALGVAVGFPPGDVVRSALASIVFAANLPVVTETANPFVNLWTVAMEAQFYLVWPLILTVGRRVSVRALAAVVALGLAVSLGLRFAPDITTDDGYHASYFLPQTNVFALLAGVLGALLLEELPSMQVPRWTWRVAVFGMLAVTVIPGLKDGLHESHTASTLVWRLLAGPITVPCALGLVLAVVTASTSVPAWLTSPPILFFGTISYGLYLWHGILDASLGEIIGVSGVPGLVSGVVTAVLATGVAVVSYRYVEVPFLRRKQRFERVTLRVGATSADAVPGHDVAT